MTFTSSDQAHASDYAARRATAIANANWFRALARWALRDGKPESELRAAKARKAARLVVARARCDGLLMHRRVAAI